MKNSALPPRTSTVSPPKRQTTTVLVFRAYATFILFFAMTSGAWNNLFGPAVTFMFILAATVFTLILWRRSAEAASRNIRTIWRRLPRTAIIYCLYALCSVLWSAWAGTSIITWILLAGTTINGLFIAAVFTWREILQMIKTALRLVLGISIVFELWVSLVLQHPLRPPSLADAPEKIPLTLMWSRNNLFTSERIQGIVGDANLIGILGILALVVFAITVSSSVSSERWAIAWMILAGFFVFRSESATSYIILLAVMITLALVIMMREVQQHTRSMMYRITVPTLATLGVIGFIFRDSVFFFLGRTGDLTGRDVIWKTVLERAGEKPLFGWGFATPWLPWDPAFVDWVTYNGVTVFMAHNMWVDVFLQLGFVGTVLMWIMMGSLLWRSWFFAVDRPRWDLVGTRPFSMISMLPVLVLVMLLVQGLTESRPLMEWGWLVMVMFTFKMKISPIVGVDDNEISPTLSRKR